MKKSVLIIILSLNLFAKSINTITNTNHNFFIENKGQWPEEVFYLSKIGGMNAWITKTGVVYDYYIIEKNYDLEEVIKMTPQERDEFEINNTSIKGHFVKMNLVDSNPNPGMIGRSEQETYYNYFIGNDESKWTSHVPLYSEIEIDEIYEGIGIRYYFDEGLLRYDYLVRPNADLSQLRINLEGQVGFLINDKGELVIETSLGEVIHGNLYAYQGDTEVDCNFMLNSNDELSVMVKNYDRSKELIIDPLVYSTYLGAGNNDHTYTIDIDLSGSTIVAGFTLSQNFPIKIGSYQEEFGGGVADAFISKFDENCEELIFSTFIGGSITDIIYAITLDDLNNVYCTGLTGSIDFPISDEVFQNQFGGGSRDIFVAKLNSTGSNLIQSSYLGGSGDFERGYGICTDVLNNIIISGVTSSNNFPVTQSAFQITHGGGDDGFITKISSDFSSLLYSTYLGGSGTDEVKSSKINSDDEIFICGTTTSTNFPVTEDAFQTEFGLDRDVFITRLNSDGSELVYSTYLGGSGTDMGDAIAIDNLNNAFITGYTYLDESTNDFPITPNVLKLNPEVDEAFVTKINSTGTELIYSTFLGGKNNDRGYSINVDNEGNTIIVGETRFDFPTTPGAFQTSPVGDYEAFITKLNQDGSQLIYSTFLAGSNIDAAYSVVSDNTGNVFLTGWTESQDFPTNNAAFQTTSNGGNEVFITKMSLPSSNDQLTPVMGTNSLDFGSSLIIIDLDVSSIDDINCSYYPNSSPTDGTLPDEIEIIAEYFWILNSHSIIFNNGKVSIPISDLTGVTDASKLHWLKRENSGDAWTDIGGTIVGSNLESTVAFNSFSEFTIGSTDASNPLPVELTYFTATVNNENITLNWETATEVNNYGFNIERTLDNQAWESLGFVQGHGTTNSPKNYSFTDNDLPNVESVDYRLKQIDNDGTFAYSKTITVDLTSITSVEVDEIPTVYSLEQNYPNPFNPTTTIKFGLPEVAAVHLSVYNILGEQVIELVNQELEAGYHQYKLNASHLSSGVYIYQIKAGEFIDTKKLILLK